MPDPPTYGFHPDFIPYGQQHTAPENYSGAFLSYPMPVPDVSYTFDENPQKPITSNFSGSNDESQTKLSQHYGYINFPPSGYSWQNLTSEDVFPEKNAVRAGKDQDGANIYVGRAFHEGDMIPAKVIPEKNVAYISYGGEEIAKNEFEILRSGDFVWEFATDGQIPTGAVEIGRTADGEKLFMGRCLYQGTQTPGKIQPSHGCLYIPFEGEEIPVNEYEVLVVK